MLLHKDTANPPVVALMVPQVDAYYTEGKIFFFAKHLKEEGFSPLIVIWDDNSEQGAKGSECPYLKLRMSPVSVDVTQEAKKALAILSNPVVPPNGPVPPPTWGDLIVLDDYLGGAVARDISGAEGLNPSAIVTTIPGAENSTQEDSIFSLSIWRFARANNIPLVTLNASSLRNDLRMIRYPADMALTKGDPRSIPHYEKLAKQVFSLPTAHWYCLRPGKDPVLESFLLQEKQLRAQAGPPNARFLHVPFSIGFKSYLYRQLDAAKPYFKELLDHNFYLLFTCSSGVYRRGLTEKDVIMKGAYRFLGDWPLSRVVVVENAPVFMCSLISEAVLAPFHSAYTEMLGLWGHPLIFPGEEHKIGNLSCSVSVGQAVRFLLESK
jgi:hypothetical protein